MTSAKEVNTRRLFVCLLFVCLVSTSHKTIDRIFVTILSEMYLLFHLSFHLFNLGSRPHLNPDPRTFMENSSAMRDKTFSPFWLRSLENWSDLDENVTIEVSLDKEVFVKFWKLARRIATRSICNLMAQLVLATLPFGGKSSSKNRRMQRTQLQLKIFFSVSLQLAAF